MGSWKDVALSEQLVAAIIEDASIKRALFPPVGPNASMKKGGGKSKTESHWKICVTLFSTHEKYKAEFEKAKTAQEKVVWSNKIKNRLRA